MRKSRAAPDAPFAKLKIALVADTLTAACLAPECRVRQIGPIDGPFVLRWWRPDVLLVESAWTGFRNAWKYRVAAYPDMPKRNNRRLEALVLLARGLGIPNVFWNKEDGVHFDRFKDSARFFDVILTVDSNCVARYRDLTGGSARVDTMMFAVQPRFHHFTGHDFSDPTCNFVGSYSRHVHPERRQWQDAVFSAAIASGLGLTVYDRNSGRANDVYRLPFAEGVTVRPSVGNAETAAVYRRHRVSLNVNTIVDSPTMFSRRLIEILASGGVALTSPSLAVDTLFRDYCHVAASGEEASELLARFSEGVGAADRERARAAADHVASRHTWARRLEQICAVAGL